MIFNLLLFEQSLKQVLVILYHCYYAQTITKDSASTTTEYLLIYLISFLEQILHYF